eukprot:TRINITY_DN32601_c0_g1_i1.p1 TRINITY_DN32601_c0_g1~~TRINITY_DN32601_c0_g1_i1.p1  ORF type:complete len:387 (+),score=25.60 TRINITY_DN32601_c0_g1_i1:66-1226(+)
MPLLLLSRLARLVLVMFALVAAIPPLGRHVGFEPSSSARSLAASYEASENSRRPRRRLVEGYRPLPPAKFIVRYAVLSQQGGSRDRWMYHVHLLWASLCSVERQLAPTLRKHRAFKTSPLYVIYTDNRTHADVHHVIHRSKSIAIDVMRRGSGVRVLNLDNPATNTRLNASGRAEARVLEGLSVDAKNHAAVRRVFADAALLPANSGRLLLGTDISFTASPWGLLNRAALLNSSQALYMADRFYFGGPLYTLLNYKGPQCRGLIGDFVWLGPGLRLDPERLAAKMWWYMYSAMQDPTDPPCKALCSLSNNLHAMDQFALNLAVAEASVPVGYRGCHPLSRSYMQPSARKISLLGREGRKIEAVHFKQPCGPGCTFPGKHELFDIEW